MIFNKNCFKTLFFPCKKITLNQQQIFLWAILCIVILTPNQLTSEIPRVMKLIVIMNGPIFPEIINKKYNFAAFLKFFLNLVLYSPPARFVSMEYSLSRVWSVSSKHTTVVCDIKISSKN